MKATRRNKNKQDVDVFLAFQMRIRSLEFFRDEVRRHQVRGEEVLAEIAALRATGDPLRDARVRAGWEEQLEEIFEDFGCALDKLWWEMQP